MNDLGRPDAVPVPKEEYDRIWALSLKEQVVPPSIIVSEPTDV
jgi:hypothetical protein